MPARIEVVDDPAAVARAALALWRGSAAMAVASRGRFTVALAGGATPEGLYTLLGNEPGVGDWGRTHVFFGDERSVPPGHADSNYHMACRTLLSRVGIPPTQVHRLRGEATDLAAEASRYADDLRAALGAAPGATPILDLALLGMGADGHTASLFPGTSALAEERALCVANHVPRMNTRRLTLTWPVFEAARQVVFLVAGTDKADPLHQVLEGPPAPAALPSQRLLRGARVILLIDRAAGARLSDPGTGRRT